MARVVDADSVFFSEIARKFSSHELTPEINQRIWTHAWRVAFSNEIISIVHDAARSGHLQATKTEMGVLASHLKHVRDGGEGGFAAFLLHTLFLVVEKYLKYSVEDRGDLIKALRRAVQSPSAFKSVTDAASSILERSGTRLFLAFDGMDRFYDLPDLRYESTTHRMRQVFVISLLYAVADMANTRLLKRVDLKVMLPLDKVISLHFRDKVKSDQYAYEIQWTGRELLEFCAKRIHATAGPVVPSGLTDDSAWKAIFPDKLSHAVDRSLEESTFDYVLRHTLMRPRDFQVHWKMIHDLSEGGVVTEDSLREGVRIGAERLATYYFDEWAGEFPFLPGILDLFRESASVFVYDSSFRDVLSSAVSLVNSYLEVEAVGSAIALPFRTAQKRNKNGCVMVTREFVLQLLYSVGFLGKLREGALVETESRVLEFASKKYSCWFYCYQKYPNISAGDTLVIHPIFYERYAIRPSEPLIVGPHH